MGASGSTPKADDQAARKDSGEGGLSTPSTTASSDSQESFPEVPDDDPAGQATAQSAPTSATGHEPEQPSQDAGGAADPVPPGGEQGSSSSQAKGKGKGKAGKGSPAPPPPPAGGPSRAEFLAAREAREVRQTRFPAPSKPEEAQIEVPPGPAPPLGPCSDPAMVDAGGVLRAAAVAEMPQPAKAWRQTLEGILRRHPPALRPRLLVLPEGAIVEPGLCNASHPAVRELQSVAEEFDVVIVAGTMQEARGDGSTGKTCPIIDASGLVGRYHERSSSRFSYSGPGVFETRLGKIGVLSCADIENVGLLLETARQVAIIASPTRLPYTPVGSWSIALDTAQRRLEWWTSTLGVSVVRCDLPPPGGMGCSMAVTPCETLLPGRAGDCLVSALLPANPRRRLQSWMATRWRAEQLDNAGARIVAQAVPDREEAEEAMEAGLEGAAGVECRPDTLGLRWERPEGEVLHRLLLPEPVRSVRQVSGSLRAEGSLSGAWLVWPVQNRLRTDFGRLWGPQPADAADVCRDIAASSAAAAPSAPSSASGKGPEQPIKGAGGGGGKAKGKCKAAPPPPKGPVRPAKEGGKASWTRRPATPAASGVREADLWAHYRSLAPCDIGAVPWLEAQQVMWAQGGSGGVLLVELPGLQAVCIKPQGLNAVSEFLAQHVAEALGVPVARCRVLRVGRAGEAGEVRRGVMAAPVAVPGHEVHVASALVGSGGVWAAREFLGVLDFVPGIGMQGPLAREALMVPGPGVLRGLGRLCALDVLLNNLDRAPLPVWDNEGNLANILMVGDGVVGIDQQVNAIGEGPGLSRFLDRVRALCGEAACPDATGPTAARLRQALLQDYGVELDAEALACAARGAAGAFRGSYADVGLPRVGSMAAFVRRTASEIREASR
mmetsp:Transcript_84913/g.253108  ORF Transcript_84913/g.253108 Transcript_84913/m.253108 type:complete len:891 (-) Transcript_84913:133-2805(-)